MRLDAPINTHSCKYGLPGFDVDEIFELTDQKLRLVNFDRCLAADVMDAGTAVNSIACEDAHGWQVHADGRVTPAAAANLCLTLAAERVFVNSGIGYGAALLFQSREPGTLCARDRLPAAVALVGNRRTQHV